MSAFMCGASQLLPRLPCAVPVCAAVPAASRCCAFPWSLGSGVLLSRTEEAEGYVGLLSTDVADVSATPVTILFVVVKVESEALEAGNDLAAEEVTGWTGEDYLLLRLCIVSTFYCNKREQQSSYSFFSGPLVSGETLALELLESTWACRRKNTVGRKSSVDEKVAGYCVLVVFDGFSLRAFFMPARFARTVIWCSLDSSSTVSSSDDG